MTSPVVSERNAVIEECAKVVDVQAADYRRLQNQCLDGEAPMVAERTWCHFAEAAEWCAKDVRALKSASPVLVSREPTPNQEGECHVELNTTNAPEFRTKVALRYFALPLTRFALATAPDGSYRFDVAVEVPNQASGKPMELHWAMYFPKMEDKAIVAQMYLTLHNMLIHELAESWLIDGVRPDDPHGDLGPMSAYRPASPSGASPAAPDVNEAQLREAWERGFNFLARRLNDVLLAAPVNCVPQREEDVAALSPSGSAAT